jgi:hypothetical protein
MNVYTLRNKFSSFLMLVLMVMALSMLTACSSTSDGDELGDLSGSSSSLMADASIRQICQGQCEDIDVDCVEVCIVKATP